MTRASRGARGLILRGAAVATALLAVAPAATPREPASLNVLLILVEDLGADRGGAAMPALDRLGQRGRRFDQAYAQYPASAPSRASLLTGMRPETTQVWEEQPRERPRDSFPIQEHFASRGYWTARVGAVYRGEAEAELRWDAALDVSRDGPGPAAQAARLLKQRPDAPFLMAVGLTHEAAPESEGEAEPTPLASPPSPLPPIAVGHTGFFARPGGLRQIAPLQPAERRGRVARQVAWASWVDGQLGALMESLDREGLLGRTAIVFAGDHGADLGRNGELPRPDVLLESTLRVPLVVAAPGLAAPGRRSDALVELLDVYPTLLELTGVSRVPDLEGTSLGPLLRDPQASVRRAVFSAVERRAGQVGRSVRTRDYRYNEWPDGSVELYDHRADPHEFTNLAGTPAAREPVRALRALLDERERGSRLDWPRRGPREQPARPRNVLLIAFDDLATELGTYGAPVSTPSIDALARRGRRFDRAYAQAPECTPSRLSFLTGWWPERVVVTDYLDHSERPQRRQLGWLPIQEHFRNHGYFTARVGKIDDSLFPEEFGWELTERRTEAPEELQGSVSEAIDRHGWWSPERYLGPRQGNRPGWWIATGNADALEPDALRAQRAVELMEQRRDRPFFIALGFTTPHLRWVAPERWFERYDPDEVRLREPPVDDLADVPAIALKRDPQDRPGAPLEGLPAPLYGPPRDTPGLIDDPALRRQATAAYRAAISFADAQVGVLMEALDRLELWDDTVVVLLSDHGYHLGDHRGLWRKDTLFEESLRVPLIVAAPGVGYAGVATGELAELTDVYPTVAELAGLPDPPGLDGVSLVPLLRDPQSPVRRAAVSVRECRAPDLGVSVRSGGWRYTEWPDGTRELYDLRPGGDPTRDLARNPASASELARLRGVLDRGYLAAVASATSPGGVSARGGRSAR